MQRVYEITGLQSRGSRIDGIDCWLQILSLDLAYIKLTKDINPKAKPLRDSIGANSH